MSAALLHSKPGALFRQVAAARRARLFAGADWAMADASIEVNAGPSQNAHAQLRTAATGWLARWAKPQKKGSIRQRDQRTSWRQKRWGRRPGAPFLSVGRHSCRGPQGQAGRAPSGPVAEPSASEGDWPHWPVGHVGKEGVGRAEVAMGGKWKLALPTIIPTANNVPQAKEVMFDQLGQ